MTLIILIGIQSQCQFPSVEMSIYHGMFEDLRHCSTNHLFGIKHIFILINCNRVFACDSFQCSPQWARMFASLLLGFAIFISENIAKCIALIRFRTSMSCWLMGITIIGRTFLTLDGKFSGHVGKLTAYTWIIQFIALKGWEKRFLQ